MWIHERDGWPDFHWKMDELGPKLAAVRYHQGRVLGRMSGLGLNTRRMASLSMLTDDVVKSSAIEGESLSSLEVRSSVARRLGLDIAGLVRSSRTVEGVVTMTLDATQGAQSELTINRLFSWHAALFPTGHSGMEQIKVGSWRDEDSGRMQVVSGPLGRERVHFEAPRAGRVEQEMGRFLAWFDAGTELDPLLKAAIAHFWFVTIHPFEDGNGRIARAVADMALARADGVSERFYSLSAQIELEREDYYYQLEQHQRGDLDLTSWLDWFLGCLDRAITRAEGILVSVLRRASLWQEINRVPINKRQHLILGRMLEDNFKGYMNTSKYAKLAKCSADTALRDIQELTDRGILVKNPGGGRSTSYRLLELDTIE